MQVSVETVSNIERRMTIGVPANRIETEVQKRLQKAAKTIRLDGFRPGKVPMKVITQRYGAGVRQEVIGEVMQNSFFDAVKQEALNPAGYPKIEPKVNEPGKDLEYIATFEIYPQIELGDLSAIKIDKQVATITDADVDNMIEQLRKQQQKWEPVTRKAKLEDQTVINFSGTIDGEAFEGGTGEDHKLVLGSKSMIAGFEEGIVGMKADEEKTLALTFPEEYHAKELAGKAVEFLVKVTEINEPVLPELDEEFYKLFGVEEGGEAEFREEVSKNMERELNKATRTKVKTAVVDALIAAHDVSIPAALLDQETARLREEMMAQFGGAQKIDKDMLPAELFKDQAVKRVTSGLLINKYIEEHDIKPDEDKLKAVVEEMAASYEDPAEVVNYIYADKQQLDHFRSLAQEDQVIDSLLEAINVNEVECSYEEAVKPAEPKATDESQDKTEDPE